MKRLLTLALSLAMVLSLAVGCGKTETPPAAEPSDAPAATSDLKVALLLAGPMNDAGWNATAYQGLELIKEKLGVETNYTESVPQSNYEEVFRNYASSGYNLIFGHGYEFSDAAKVVAKEFPDVNFVITSTDVSQPDNVASVNTLPIEMGLLQGVACAYATKTGTIGLIGGLSIPPITDALNSAAAGILMTKPDTKVLMNLTGSFEDAGKAKETALAMIDQGADIIIYDADAAGIGALEACKERNVMASPCIADQKDLAPENVLLSGISDVPAAMEKVVEYVQDGSFKAQFYSMGVSTGCVNYVVNEPVWNKVMPEEGKADVEKVFNQLKNNEIDAYKICDEYLPAEMKLG